MALIGQLFFVVPDSVAEYEVRLNLALAFLKVGCASKDCGWIVTRSCLISGQLAVTELRIASEPHNYSTKPEL